MQDHLHPNNNEILVLQVRSQQFLHQVQHLILLYQNCFDSYLLNYFDYYSMNFDSHLNCYYLLFDLCLNLVHYLCLNFDYYLYLNLCYCLLMVLKEQVIELHDQHHLFQNFHRMQLMIHLFVQIVKQQHLRQLELQLLSFFVILTMFHIVFELLLVLLFVILILFSHFLK